jgi:hypothetical protein
MAKNKTTETKASVKSFLSTIKDEKRRSDCAAIVNLMKEQTGHEPKMWGTAIIGIGSYHYKYESGREGDAPMAGLASRANGIVLYLASEPEEKETLLKKLGKHKVGGGCVYINKLEDIDTTVLSKLIKNSIKYYQKKYPG